MSYRAGIQGFGMHTDPMLSCDGTSCDVRMTVKPGRAGMPAWLRDQKAPKGWKRWPFGDRALYTCPMCSQIADIELKNKRAK